MPSKSAIDNKSTATLQLDASESTVRTVSSTPFIPINEETVFLDAEPVTSSGNSILLRLIRKPSKYSQKLHRLKNVQNDPKHEKIVQIFI